MKHAVFSLVSAAALTACAGQYTYVPTSNATASVGGRIAADYKIPDEAPRGDVRAVSYGITQIASTAAPDGHVSAVHLRLIVANNSGAKWTLDTR